MLLFVFFCGVVVGASVGVVAAGLCAAVKDDLDELQGDR